MKRKIDAVEGRLIHNRRLATAEPVFAHICSTLGLNRFTLRGKRKVNIQWLLYCTVHNLLKVHRTDMAMHEEEIRGKGFRDRTGMSVLYLLHWDNRRGQMHDTI